MSATNRIYCKDALAGLANIKDNSVDLVITDPPYNIASKHKNTIRNSKVITTHKAFGAWDILHPFDHDVLIFRVLSECYRVLKPGGAMYMFIAHQDSGYFIRKAMQRGFTYRNQLAMVKKTVVPSMFKNSWRSGFETCMYLTKGKQKTFNFPTQREACNVHEWAIQSKQTKHPTEKPLAFIELLVRVSSSKGELVVDPFMGSGTTAVACAKLGRQYLGFEREPAYVLIARERLKKVRSQ